MPIETWGSVRSIFSQVFVFLVYLEEVTLIVKMFCCACWEKSSEVFECVVYFFLESSLSLSGLFLVRKQPTHRATLCRVFKLSSSE